MENAVVEDTSRTGMARAVEENLAAFTDFWSAAPSAELVHVGGTDAYFTGVAFPLFNGSTRVRFPEEAADEALEALIGEANRRELPMLLWIGPSSTPADVVGRLRTRGFHIDEPAPGMAIDLENLPNQELPADVSVERVATEQSLEESVRLVVNGFGMPDWLLEPTTRLMGLSGLSDTATWQNFLVRLEGKPVATASVAYLAGVAGIYNVATLKEARGRGLGRIATLAPLLQARERGYRVGALQSSALGFSVYQRLGFQHVCDFYLCAWMGEPPEA
jgi:GNAT superfamily N-acetyltransferase